MSKYTLQKLCKERNVKASFIEIPERTNKNDNNWPAGSRHFIVVIKRGKKALQTEYSCGPGVKLTVADVPHVSDILASLLSDGSAAHDTFDDFCSNFGYDTDSRKAYAIWEACHKIDGQLE